MNTHSSVSVPRTLILALTTALLVGGCAGSKVRDLWPFGKKPIPPPQAVQVLELSAIDGAPTPAVLQYWVRNTLLLDLQQAGANGAVQLAPPAGQRWPVRIAFRITPGQFTALEVRAAQRAVLPVRSDGPGPIEISLAPSVWAQDSANMQLRWGVPPPPPAPEPPTPESAATESAAPPAAQLPAAPVADAPAPPPPPPMTEPPVPPTP